MYKRKGMCLIFLVVLLTGCNAGQETSEEQKSDMVQPIHFEPETDENNRYKSRQPSIGERGGYPQSKQEAANKSDFAHYSDSFTNEESARITEELSKQKDIIQAQAASTEDRIVVSVILREHFNHDISHNIKEEVRKIVPNTDKQIIVYTDDIEWDRMKNLDARLQAKNNGDDLEAFIKELFQLKDE
ncbi:YhcN/YlaJ family sporulation lipoprotein [Oceanobacillus sp. FSL K6-2867]|uniref:YhcN/YlaJ family sporulation lipoprotein n=1 Tax=Oceanobacillus sp. FSL K6-2867 TaxID=2954748 RepID=UPI0030D97278